MLNEKVAVIFDRKKVAEKRGLGKVEIRIYISRKERKYISMGDVSANEWKTFAESPKVKIERQRCEQILAAMNVLGEEMSIQRFDTFYYGCGTFELPKRIAETKVNQKPSLDFIKYMKECIDNEDIREGTRKHKICTWEALKRFGKIKTVNDLTKKNLVAFDQWLHDGTRTDVSVHTYHKHLHTYTHRLYIEERIPIDPYSQVKFKRGRSKEREPLTEKELLKMRKMKLEGKMEHVRDLFVFAAYTGLAFSDVKAFDFKKMVEQEGKMYYIDGSRIKTDSRFFTPILKPAMDVLVKYNYKLPKISNQKANDYLHLIEAALGLNKTLTFHIARHSFATLALAHDIPIENVARMLGHQNIRTTQIYAKVLKTTIERHAMNLQNAIK